MVASTKAA